MTLQQKSDVYLQINSQETNFYGKYAWETETKDWITWGGGKYSDYHAANAISTIPAKATSAESIYSLQGVRMNKLQKGVNIVNGKKVVMK